MWLQKVLLVGMPLGELVFKVTSSGTSNAKLQSSMTILSVNASSNKKIFNCLILVNRSKNLKRLFYDPLKLFKTVNSIGYHTLRFEVEVYVFVSIKY